MEATERQIHSILFPNVEFAWEDFCRANGISPVPNNPKGQQPGDDLPEDAVARVQFHPSDGHDGRKFASVQAGPDNQSTAVSYYAGRRASALIQITGCTLRIGCW